MTKRDPTELAQSRFVVDRELAAGLVCALPVGPQRKRVLAQLSRDANVLVRNALAENLVQLGSEAAGLLFRLLGDREWLVRASAAESLGEVGPYSSLSRLTEVAKTDRNHVVRSCAAESIGLLGKRATRESLETMLANEPNDHARLGILAGLHFAGRRRIWTEMLPLAESTDYRTRIAAISMLERFAKGEGLIATRKLLTRRLAKDPAVSVRARIKSFLESTEPKYRETRGASADR